MLSPFKAFKGSDTSDQGVRLPERFERRSFGPIKISDPSSTLDRSTATDRRGARGERPRTRSTARGVEIPAPAHRSSPSTPSNSLRVARRDRCAALRALRSGPPRPPRQSVAVEFKGSDCLVRIPLFNDADPLIPHAETGAGRPLRAGVSRGGAEDRERPRRRERLNADPKVRAFGAVDGEGLCTPAECATRRAVLRASAHLRVKHVARRSANAIARGAGTRDLQRVAYGVNCLSRLPTRPSRTPRAGCGSHPRSAPARSPPPRARCTARRSRRRDAAPPPSAPVRSRRVRSGR